MSLTSLFTNLADVLEKQPKKKQKTAKPATGATSAEAHAARALIMRQDRNARYYAAFKKLGFADVTVSQLASVLGYGEVSINSTFRRMLLEGDGLIEKAGAISSEYNAAILWRWIGPECLPHPAPKRKRKERESKGRYKHASEIG